MNYLTHCSKSLNLFQSSLFIQVPSLAQRAEHLRLFLEHLQLPVQATLKPQLAIIRQPELALSKAVHSVSVYHSIRSKMARKVFHENYMDRNWLKKIFNQAEIFVTYFYLK